MKFLFYFLNENSWRDAPLSYTSLISRCGFSGTETALLEMAKHLVDKGHSVQIYGDPNTYTDHNIQYIAEHDLDKVDTDVDWYSPLFFLSYNAHMQLLHRLNPARTKVFLWFHCFIEDRYIIDLKNRFRVYGQYVCRYVADAYSHIVDKTNSWVVYNGVNTIFTTEQIPSTKQGNWIFHATYERGGNVARQIFSKVNALTPDVAKTLNMLSYYTPDVHRNISSSNIINHGSKTKLEVRDLLLQSDYFVYPLVLDDGRVHHDTFGSVMLEALACGVIVIVWDVACVSTVYGDHVVKIPVPDHVKHYYNPHARFASCHWMLSDEAQQMFIDKINELEADQAKKEQIRAKGVEWARAITWDVLAADMETQLLAH